MAETRSIGTTKREVLALADWLPRHAGGADISGDL
jgi:hypothetical protein